MAAGQVIQISDLPAELKNEPINLTENLIGNWREQLQREVARSFISGESNIHKKFIDEIEKILIKEALKTANNRRIDAAKALGIGRNTITRKIKELSI